MAVKADANIVIEFQIRDEEFGSNKEADIHQEVKNFFGRLYSEYASIHSYDIKFLSVFNIRDDSQTQDQAHGHAMEQARGNPNATTDYKGTKDAPQAVEQIKEDQKGDEKKDLPHPTEAQIPGRATDSAPEEMKKYQK